MILGNFSAAVQDPDGTPQFGIPINHDTWLKQYMFLQNTRMMPHDKSDNICALPTMSNNSYMCKITSNDKIRVGDRVVLMPPSNTKRGPGYYYFPQLMTLQTAKIINREKIAEDILAMAKYQQDPPHMAASLVENVSDIGNIAIKLYCGSVCCVPLIDLLVKPIENFLVNHGRQALQDTDVETITTNIRVLKDRLIDAQHLSDSDIKSLVASFLSMAETIYKLLNPTVIGTVTGLVGGEVSESFAGCGDYINVHIIV